MYLPHPCAGRESVSFRAKRKGDRRQVHTKDAYVSLEFPCVRGWSKTHIALSIVSTKFAVQKSLERVAEERGVRVEDGLEQPVVVRRPKLGEGHVEVFACLSYGDRSDRLGRWSAFFPFWPSTLSLCRSSAIYLGFSSFARLGGGIFYFPLW